MYINISGVVTRIDFKNKKIIRKLNGVPYEDLRYLPKAKESGKHILGNIAAFKVTLPREKEDGYNDSVEW